MLYLSSPSFSRLAVCAMVAVSFSSCSFLRGDGTKQRLDAPREHPHHSADAKPRTMVIEVTTDANSTIVGLVFKRGSGSDAVDNYVAENIRHTWPYNPSNRSVVELVCAADKSFSEPKLISSSPAP